MAGPQTVEINCETGEVTYRELTAAEIAEAEASIKKAIEEQEAVKTAHEQMLANKESGNQKLKDLGLTDDEIAALTS